MFGTNIPFEIHITVDDFEKEREIEFIQFCIEKVSKPIMIELSKGEHLKQPMLSKVTFSNNPKSILDNAQTIVKQLKLKKFTPVRVKIEVPSSEMDLFKNSTFILNNYFEWHGKIKLKKIDDLLFICKNHQVHLSHNSLKNESEIRFITLREFDSKLVFENRIANLLDDLKNGNWHVLKQQSEYCIYDSNKMLDKGWLTIEKCDNE